MSNDVQTSQLFLQLERENCLLPRATSAQEPPPECGFAAAESDRRESRDEGFLLPPAQLSLTPSARLLLGLPAPVSADSLALAAQTGRRLACDITHSHFGPAGAAGAVAVATGRQASRNEFQLYEEGPAAPAGGQWWLRAPEGERLSRGFRPWREARRLLLSSSGPWLPSACACIVQRGCANRHWEPGSHEPRDNPEVTHV